MRKNINLPVFAVVGATALFVGFARNVRAIPDSPGSWNPGNQQSDYDAVLSIARSNGNQSLTGISSFAVFAADLKKNNGKPHDIVALHFERDNHVTPISSSPGVPDGGTTAMMLGGTLCGLFLVAKKKKV